MSDLKNIANIRRDYGQLSLSEESIDADPIVQFKAWFSEVLNVETSDPTAMLLSTVDGDGHPDSRVVLLKGVEDGHFIFYTNYLSAKAKQMDGSPHVAANFYWPQMVRQVRIRGQVEKISTQASDLYFASRPFNSQMSAVVSPQSQEISSRSVLETALNDLIKTNESGQIARPLHWGGYKIKPMEIEFWQGRDNRLHDRIRYIRQKNAWTFHRLAP